MILRICLLAAATLPAGAVLLSPAAAWAQVSSDALGTAAISGRVITKDKKPVARAFVAAHRSSVDGPLKATERRDAMSDADGRFSIAGLQGGPYIICVAAPRTDLLDPCAWSTPPVIRVAAGGASSGNEIEVESGALVRIRIDDNARLFQPLAKSANTSIQAGIWTESGHYRPVMWESSDKRGHNYQVAVPDGLRFKLLLRGQNVAFRDNAGAKLRDDAPPSMVAQKQASSQIHKFSLESPGKP